MIGPLPLRLALGAAFLALALTTYVTVRLQAQIVQAGHDRHAAIQANLRARHDDCMAGNRLRAAILHVVELREGAATHDLTLERRAFGPRDCRAYVERARPRGFR